MSPFTQAGAHNIARVAMTSRHQQNDDSYMGTKMMDRSLANTEKFPDDQDFDDDNDKVFKMISMIAMTAKLR